MTYHPWGKGEPHKHPEQPNLPPMTIPELIAGSVILILILVLFAAAVYWVLHRETPEIPQDVPQTVWVIDMDGKKKPMSLTRLDSVKPIEWAMSLDLLKGTEGRVTRWAYTRECEKNPKLAYQVADLFRIHDHLRSWP